MGILHEIAFTSDHSLSWQMYPRGSSPLKEKGEKRKEKTLNNIVAIMRFFLQQNDSFLLIAIKIKLSLIYFSSF